MSSKLQPHSDLILRMVLEGLTYKKIVEVLENEGFKTTHANVNLWVHRRAKKMVSRAQMFNPLVVQKMAVKVEKSAPDSTPSTYLDLYFH